MQNHLYLFVRIERITMVRCSQSQEVKFKKYKSVIFILKAFIAPAERTFAFAAIAEAQIFDTAIAVELCS